MKTLLQLLLILVINISCRSNANKENVETVSKIPTVLIPDLEISMPGNIYIVGSKALIESVRMTEQLFFAYDLDSAKLISKFCNKGKSNTEFIQAQLMVNNDSVITAYDFTDKKISFSLKDFSIIDSAENVERKKPVVFDKCVVGDDSYVSINSINEGDILTYYHQGNTTTFGEFPIEGKFTNRGEYTVGELKFDEKNSILYFFSSTMPYVAKYKLVDDKFELDKSWFYDEYDKEESDGKLIVTYDDLLITNVTFSKDYIIKSQRTQEEQIEYLSEPNSGQDAAVVSPHNLFLYDYDLNLVKIVKLGTPIIRYVAYQDSNDVYIVGSTDGLYNIAKVEL